jgi:hypothetical protein
VLTSREGAEARAFSRKRSEWKKKFEKTNPSSKAYAGIPTARKMLNRFQRTMAANR